MRLIPLLFLIGCGGSFTFAPGDQYHCNEALVQSLGELQKAVVKAEVSCRLAESVSPLSGDSKDVQ